MIYINLFIVISILVFLLIFFARSIRYKDYVPIDLDKKKHKLYFLYPMVAMFLKSTRLDKRLLNNSNLANKIRSLNISDHHEPQIKLYWYQKSSVILVIIFAFSCFSLIASIQSLIERSEIFDAYLVRPEEEEGDDQIRLKFKMEGKSNKDDFYEDEIVIHNRTRTYTDEEWKELLEKSIPYLEEKMLGKNEAANHVDMSLNFIKEIKGTGIVVEWIPKNYRLVSGNGEINNIDMAEDRVETLVTAILKYGERRVEHTMPITIYPLQLDRKKLLYRELLEALNIAEQETGMLKEWRLPSKIGEYILTWELPVRNSALTYLILGLFASVLIWFYRDKELDKKMKHRNNQMLHDYPEIINKFNLLVNAGMTIKQAWIKISEDYRKKADKDQGYTRYVYEEMLLTLNELKLGIAEVNAYERFGKRTGQLPFMKFSSMLVQNLKKGNKNMVDLLNREAIEAFQERKDNTKRLGEEASTKLLGPMIILLFIVLIIIMIPAFVSFQM